MNYMNLLLTFQNAVYKLSNISSPKKLSVQWSGYLYRRLLDYFFSL